MSYLHRRFYAGTPEGLVPSEVVVQPHKGEWLATVWTTKPNGLAIPAQSFKTLEEGKYRMFSPAGITLHVRRGSGQRVQSHPQ